MLAMTKDSTTAIATFALALLRAVAMTTAHAQRVASGSTGNAPTTATPIGVIENRDFCMHESFSARCQPGSLVLMLTALYGRMRLGRCISGDYNVGCSTDVISYFDAQCTGRRSCDVSVRNLVEIHPCQRDFTSYLDASYRCIQVAGWGLAECPAVGRVLAHGPTGYLAQFHGISAPTGNSLGTPSSKVTSHPVGQSQPSQQQQQQQQAVRSTLVVGVDSCPWTIIVQPGQTVSLRIILLPPEAVGSRGTKSGSSGSVASDHSTGSVLGCSATFVIREQASDSMTSSSYTSASDDRHLFRHRQQFNLCSPGGVTSGKSRDRHLYTSVGNQVTIHVTPTSSMSSSPRNVVGLQSARASAQSSSINGGSVGLDMASMSRFIISYEALGCPDLQAPPRAWLTRSGDNVVIRCNDTHETWYLTCQRGKWLGDAGNCSSGMQPLQHDDVTNEETVFPTHGIMLAVLTGVTLGMIMGMILLIVVHCARRRSRGRRKPRSGSGAAAAVVKLSTCRSTRDDCAKLYTCGRTPTATYFRRNSGSRGDDDEDEDDRLLFPFTSSPAANGGLGGSHIGTAGSGKLQKAAVIYEFSCSGVDRPPSASYGSGAMTLTECDLLPLRSMAEPTADLISGSMMTSSAVTDCTAGNQLVDLCRITGSQPEVVQSHCCLACPSESDIMVVTSYFPPKSSEYASVLAKSQQPSSAAVRCRRCCEVAASSSRLPTSTFEKSTQPPQLVLYESGNVGLAAATTYDDPLQQPDFRTLMNSCQGSDSGGCSGDIASVSLTDNVVRYNGFCGSPTDEPETSRNLPTDIVNIFDKSHL